MLTKIITYIYYGNKRLNNIINIIIINDVIKFGKIKEKYIYISHDKNKISLMEMQNVILLF